MKTLAYIALYHSEHHITKAVQDHQTTVHHQWGTNWFPFVGTSFDTPSYFKPTLLTKYQTLTMICYMLNGCVKDPTLQDYLVIVLEYNIDSYMLSFVETHKNVNANSNHILGVG